MNTEARGGPGKLYICGTPIGNLEDVSIRLLKTLRKVDWIVCEDTRQSVKLLKKYHIQTRLLSYHEHSSREREDYILELLQAGHSVALLSDAGMPGISDPGAELVRRAREAGIGMESVPGPSALTAAYSLAGLPDTAFIFGGFVERKAAKRREYLERMKAAGLPLIIYEAPHRLLNTLAALAEVYGAGHQILVARELTKLYEDSRLAGIAQHLERWQQQSPRGEFCIVIPPVHEGATEKSLDEIVAEVQQMVAGGMEKKEALKMKAREYGITKSVLYRYLVEMQDHQ